jgi:hypothetical protein
LKKKIIYRRTNYQASEDRVPVTIHLHPDLKYGLEMVANDSRKSVSWLVETALSDYFGVKVLLKKLKGKPREEYSP